LPECTVCFARSNAKQPCVENILVFTELQNRKKMKSHSLENRRWTGKTTWSSSQNSLTERYIILYY